MGGYGRGFQTNAIELVDEDDDIPEPIQQCADILLDLHDGYKITHVEYKVEEYDGSPCFFRTGIRSAIGG